MVPTLDEGEGIEGALAALRPLREDGHEVIVSDGGSTDGTATLAVTAADRIVAAGRGRARQMNAGAAAATGDVLVFLHADTTLPEDADRRVLEALGDRPGWGFFGVRLSGSHPAFRIIERMITLRSRLSGIATGDQAIFATRNLFENAGGFAETPLLEDVDLCRRLKRRSLPVRPRSVVTTSSRRWEAGGIVRTVLLMWWLRGAYALGAKPERLARCYRFGGSTEGEDGA
ncbi:MAG: TIGR04283 family arsenosugar biosynthesis glycosyltransferase [Immundisolibacterales bacterium]|nr:TIGR04283 family arsenosugar biosynthesis glycosyltransferase [Immundisolibacterales bacterium]